MRTLKPQRRLLTITTLTLSAAAILGGVIPALAQTVDCRMCPQNAQGGTASLASTNSCRWLRVHANYDPTQYSLQSLQVGGAIFQAPGTPNWGAGNPIQILVNNYNNIPWNYAAFSSPNGKDYYWTLGPLCGQLNMFNQHPADWPYVIGYLGSPGNDTTRPTNDAAYTISVSAVFIDTSGKPHFVSSTTNYYTVHDNDDCLLWWSGEATGINPLVVTPAQTPPGAGSGSSAYTFRVMYLSGLYSGFSLSPRWRDGATWPYGNQGFVDRSTGQAVTSGDPGPYPNGFNWTFTRWNDPFLQQTGYARDENNVRGVYEPQVVMVIDGEITRPHYMVPENPSVVANPTGTDYSQGVIYSYTVLPTDYSRFFDNLFLMPYDAPGPNPITSYPTLIHGRPTSNNYVAFTAGQHTYEFWATDDYAPPGNKAWVQVGWPGNDEHVEYIQRTGSESPDTIGNTMKLVPGKMSRSGGGSSAINFRFGSGTSGTPDPFGYPYPSNGVNASLVVNPVLSAFPFYGVAGLEGSILGGLQGSNFPIAGSLNPFNINSLADPFAPEVGAGPNPPWRTTNDDTILPNWANIFQDTDPTPDRGGKWTIGTVYTLRINYWNSNNLPPQTMRVWLRRNDPTASPGSWVPFTMQKHDVTNTAYNMGVVYEYKVTPDQLPGGGGSGDYNYYFETNDGVHSAIFPNRPPVYNEPGQAPVQDPGQLPGVPSTSTGETYYWFRVNHAPALTNANVTPASGRVGDAFTFSVTYTDVDGTALNPKPTGDRPFAAYLWVDLFGNWNGQASVSSVTNNTTLAYSTASAKLYGDGTLAGNQLLVTSGTALGKSYSIVGNTGNTITLGAASTLIGDGVKSGDQFRVSNWSRNAMSKDPANSNFAGGVNYTFNTASVLNLGPGTHPYYFVFADDWGGWAYPNNKDVRVEGEYVRYPNSGQFDGPEVIQNTPPLLTDFRFSPHSVTGADGTTATQFVFNVTYTDAQNMPPSFIHLQADDGNPADLQNLDMTPVDPTNRVYSAGVQYQSQSLMLPQGTWVIRGQTSDGVGLYPPGYPPPAILPLKGPEGTVATVTPTGMTYNVAGATFPTGRMAGQTVQMLTGKRAGSVFTIQTNSGTAFTFVSGTILTNVAAGDSFILSAAPGPLVVANTPPRLVLPANDNNIANSPGLQPKEGLSSTSFTYTIRYYDDNQYAGVRGIAPTFVRVYIDNVPHDMMPVDATDHDYTTAGNGADFSFTITGLVAAIPHTYYFIASDGQGTARSPLLTASPNFYSGPKIFAPPDAPTQLVVRDTPNDYGGSLDYSFTASLADGGGSNDVTEYHLYRNTTGAPFSSVPVIVVHANKSPSYAGHDTTALTGLLNGLNYFYTVRAYSGATIDPGNTGKPSLNPDGTLVVPIDPNHESGNSNVEGPVAAVINIAPKAPSGLAVTDPGLGGELDLSWGLSPDDGGGAKTVLSYHLYRNATGSPFTGAPIATIAKGTSTYKDTTVALGSTYYYMIRAFDGSNESPDSNVVKGTPTETHGPVFSNLAPADGSTDVPVNQVVSFTITDTGSGVDLTSLAVTITANGTPVPFALATSGTATVVNVTATPSSPLPYLVSVQVTATAKNFSKSAPATTASWQFTVTGPPTLQIAGTIFDSVTKLGVPGITVTAGSLSAVTDANGVFIIKGLVPGTYTVTPKLAGSAFVPETQTVTLPPSAAAIDFSRVPGYSISGTVVDTGGKGLVGVAVTDGRHEAITDNNGKFTIADIAAANYTLVAQLSGYTFTPSSVPVTLPPTRTGVVFTGAVQRFQISGNVQTTAGTRLGGVTVAALDASGNPIPGATTATTAAGTYVLPGLPAGFYLIQPTLAGYVFNPVQASVDLAADKTDVNFIAIQQYALTLPTGLRMVSFPITPTNLNPLANVPAGVNVVRWDPTTGAYVTPPAPPGAVPGVVQMLPGRGFFMHNLTSGPVNLAIAGDPVSTSIPFSMEVLAGWNMNGNMFNAALPWSQLGITPGEPVRDYGFLYNPVTGGYDLVTDMPGLGATNIIPKNAGFWIKSTSTQTVTVTPPVGTSAVAARAVPAKLAAGDFLIPVVAKAAGRVNATSVAGVITGADDRYRVEKPPAVSPYVDVYFVADGGVQLSCDVRSAATATQTWRFVVATDMAGATVALSLPNLAGVPQDKTVILVDETAGKALYARTMATYSYTADKTGSRQFSLQISPRLNAGLVVSAAMAQQTGGGVAVAYSLSRPASVTLTVVNLAGRPVCTLPAAGVTPAGAGRALWNLRSAGGTRVPAGRYLVQVNAVAEDGQAAQALTSVQVGR